MLSCIERATKRSAVVDELNLNVLPSNKYTLLILTAFISELINGNIPHDRTDKWTHNLGKKQV